jgi:inosose dehydratase
MRAFKEIRQLHVKQCEVGSDLLITYEKMLPELSNILVNADVKISGVYQIGHFGLWNRRREIYLHHERLARIMEKMGLQFIILSSGFLFKNHTDSKSNFQIMTREIIKRYNARGIDVGIHPHNGTSIFTFEEISSIFNFIKTPLYLVPDLYHLKKANIDFYKLQRTFSPFIKSIHIHGSTTEFKNEEELSFLFHVKNHYKGLITIESYEIMNPMLAIAQTIEDLDYLLEI